MFIYVALFYRFLGLLIWLGILLHAGFTFGVVIILGETAGFALTLAGIAGLIVSLGIAADSFIVYFERLKDEVQSGKSVRASVDRAWDSAWRTIVAADLVTALAAFVLYFLAVGSVRGFALMLGLSTALDLFVSYLYMHPAVDSGADEDLQREQDARHPSRCRRSRRACRRCTLMFAGLKRLMKGESNVDIIGRSKIWALVSLIVIGVSLG